MKCLNAHIVRRHLERGERYSVRMFMLGSELQYDACRPRADYCSDANEAIERLKQGEIIWLIQIGSLVSTVQRRFTEHAPKPCE